MEKLTKIGLVSALVPIASAGFWGKAPPIFSDFQQQENKKLKDLYDGELTHITNKLITQAVRHLKIEPQDDGFQRVLKYMEENKIIPKPQNIQVNDYLKLTDDEPNHPGALVQVIKVQPVIEKGVQEDVVYSVKPVDFSHNFKGERQPEGPSQPINIVNEHINNNISVKDLGQSIAYKYVGLNEGLRALDEAHRTHTVTMERYGNMPGAIAPPTFLETLQRTEAGQGSLVTDLWLEFKKRMRDSKATDREAKLQKIKSTYLAYVDSKQLYDNYSALLNGPAKWAVFALGTAVPATRLLGVGLALAAENVSADKYEKAYEEYKTVLKDQSKRYDELWQSVHATTPAATPPPPTPSPPIISKPVEDTIEDTIDNDEAEEIIKGMDDGDDSVFSTVGNALNKIKGLFTTDASGRTRKTSSKTRRRNKNRKKTIKIGKKKSKGSMKVKKQKQLKKKSKKSKRR